MVIDFAEKLFNILRDKYNLSEEEARGFAEGFRPFLEMPLVPNSTHATDIFKMIDKFRHPSMVRSRLTTIYRVFKQEGGFISWDRHTYFLPDPDEPPTSTPQ